MFTLWVLRQCDDPSIDQFIRPVYLRNLAGIDGEDRAIEKAREQVDAIRERIETADFKVVFAGVWDEPCNRRRGKLSVRDTINLEMIEDGRFPFGKHSGKRIADAPDGYILYFADMLPTANNMVTAALAAACQGVALEKGLIAKREAARVERAERDALSNHIGTVGERREFEGELVSSFFKADDYSQLGGYYINKVRVGDDLVTYIGKSLGERGNVIRFKATIKRHDVYKGVNTTIVNRPALLG